MTNILSILRSWTEAHPEFRLATETELAAWEKWRPLEAEEARREIEAEEARREIEAETGCGELAVVERHKLEVAVEDWCPLHAAVWRVEELPLFDGVRRREPPVLGVAMAKPTEKEWREQANQYLGSGIEVIWLVLQEKHALFVADVVVGKSFGLHEQLSPHQFLPGLAPKVSDLALPPISPTDEDQEQEL